MTEGSEPDFPPHSTVKYVDSNPPPHHSFTLYILYVQPYPIPNFYLHLVLQLALGVSTQWKVCFTKHYKVPKAAKEKVKKL